MEICFMPYDAFLVLQLLELGMLNYSFREHLVNVCIEGGIYLSSPAVTARVSVPIEILDHKE